MRRQLLSVVACALLLASFAPAAVAQDTNAPPGNSGVDQYLETVPEAGGNRPASKRNGSGLSARTQRRLKAAGADGETVSNLVASTGTARTQRSDSGSKSSGKGKAEKESSGSSDRSTSGSSGSVPGTVAAPTLGGSGSGGMGIALPLLLALSAAGAVVFALRRRRRRER